MRIYAHRGLFDTPGPGALENSMLALQRAVEAGYSVETDFRYGAAREILVFHDPTLERLLGDPRATDAVDARELARLVEARTGLAEPDLPNLTRLLAWDTWERGQALLVNVKEPDDPDFVLDLCAQISRAGREDQTYVFDLDNAAIPKVAASFPRVRLLARLSHLEGEAVQDVADLQRSVAGVWFDDYHGELLGTAIEDEVSRLDLPLFHVSPELHRDTHPLGKEGFEAAWRQVLANPRFSAICTDHPHRLRALLEGENPHEATPCGSGASS